MIKTKKLELCVNQKTERHARHARHAISHRRVRNQTVQATGVCWLLLAINKSKLRQASLACNRLAPVVITSRAREHASRVSQAELEKQRLTGACCDVPSHTTTSLSIKG